MLALRVSVWLKALGQFPPHILQATQAAWDKRSADNTLVRPSASHGRCPNLLPSRQNPSTTPPWSTAQAATFPIKTVPLDAGWNDLGTWDAVWNVLPKDEAGNAHLGGVLTTDSKNTLVHATRRLVSLVGVENLIVVETPDAVMVADKSRSQGVKHIVTQLQKTKREEHTLHRKVHRPEVGTTVSTKGDVSKLNAFRSSPKPASACINTITVRSTGS